MRILYVCADRGIPLLGSKGASAHLRSLGTALSERGHDVTIACRRLDGQNRLATGVRVEVLPEDESVHTRWLVDLLRQRGGDAVLERYSLSSGPARAAARALGLPLILEVNAPLVDEAARFRGLGDLERWRAWERSLLASSDHIVAVSPAVADHAVACGALPGRVSVVPNGVDVGRFRHADGRAVRRRLGLEESFVAGFCGSLKPWHGVADLVQAATLLPATVRLLIVGDGPERAGVECLVQRLGLSGRVVVTGAVPHDDVPAHLAAMDIGVAPYAALANFYFSPLKVTEYLAAGLPVVASDQGELRGLGSAAELVPPNDSAALATAIAALAGAPRRHRRMSHAARLLAAERSWAGVAQRVEEIIVRGVPGGLPPCARPDQVLLGRSL